MNETARNQLVLCQYMTCLPADLKLKLLEKTPTPNLQDVVDFILHTCAVNSLSCSVSKATKKAEAAHTTTVADRQSSEES